jgi:hypothetical protein
MADSTPRPADFRVDRLSVVRAWLWRHSSQPNGDPWDGDPEHLDWAAQHLLDELAQQLIGGDPSIRAAEQDPGCSRDYRDVASPGCGPLAEPPPPGASEAVVDGAQPHLDARIDCVAAAPTLDAAGPGPDDGDPLAGEVRPLLWPQGGVVPAALDVLSMTHTASGRGPARHARSGAEQ